MELTSFLLYGDQLDQLATLNMAQRGLLLTALMEAACGDIPRQGEMDPVVYVAFSFIWAQVQRDKKKFAETSARREEAGRKGGLASGEARRQHAEANGSKPKQGEANRSKVKQSEANEANGSKVKQAEAEESKPKQSEANGSNTKQMKQTETETETDSIKKESKKKKAAAPAAASGLLPSLDDAEAERLDMAFRSFAEMRKKIRAPLTDDAARLVADKLKKLAIIDGRFDTDLAVRILNQSIERSWRGIFPLKVDAAAGGGSAPAVHKPNAFHNFDQRQPDYDAIMQAARERERLEREARGG